MLEDKFMMKDELDDALGAQLTALTRSIYRALLLQSIVIVGLVFSFAIIFR